MSNVAEGSGKIRTGEVRGLWKMQEIWKFLLTLVKAVSVAAWSRNHVLVNRRVNIEQNGL